MKEPNLAYQGQGGMKFVQFHDDKELKPQALWKLVKAFEKQGDAAKAALYSKQLKDEFPNWIAPSFAVTAEPPMMIMPSLLFVAPPAPPPVPSSVTDAVPVELT